MWANFGPHLALTKPTYKEREGRIWPSPCSTSKYGRALEAVISTATA